MVILPYKDRLLLFGRYLQQLVMESLGKEKDRTGAVVHQGIAVYGNKGSTDQHAYVQQLREGVPNFFATFIQVLEERDGPSIEVEPGTTAGDYLCGFLLGTRRALYEKERDSITITIDAVTPESVGALIALYDRAVGLYAELIDTNAYHQPGVEAGKKAAAAVLELKEKIECHLSASKAPQTAGEIAGAIGQPDEVETVFKILEHLGANDRGITMKAADSPAEATFLAG
jgi:glucose-6-phosphate isomerase